MASVFGKIENPIKYKGLTDPFLGPISFLTNIINFIIILAGIFTLVNFIAAGYGYLSSGSDPQKVANAGNKILQSLAGLIIVVAAFIIAAFIGKVLFNDTSALLMLSIYKFQ